jgi:glutaredoxin-related protein
MKKYKTFFLGILFVGIFLFLILIINISLNNTKDNGIHSMEEFNQCLADNGIVIYGSEWCPACRQVVEILGGYKKVSSVYIDCVKKQEICSENKKTGYFPEIQIYGEIYTGQRTLNAFSEATGCPIPK